MIIHWTEDELQKLVTHYPTATHNEMMYILKGRSHSSIKHKAKMMGVRKINKEASSIKLDSSSKVIDSGVLSIRGNVTTHRMR